MRRQSGTPKLGFGDWISRALERAKVFKNYSSKDLSELRALGDLFLRHFPAPEEGEHVQTSRFFLYNEKTKKPAITDSEIQRALIPSTSTTLTDITVECQSLANSIRVDMQDRLQRLPSEKLYSPAVLFCAEFLGWLNQIAYQVISAEMLALLSVRVRYLQDVLGKQVFFSEPNVDFEIDKTIFLMLRTLEQRILPKIFYTLESQSLQQHFGRLKLHTEAYFRHILNALFYLYTQMPDFERFDVQNLEQTRQIQRGVDAVANAPLGQLFAHAVDAPTGGGCSARENHLLDNRGGVSQAITIRPERKSMEESGVHPGLLAIAGEGNHRFLLEKLIHVLGYTRELRTFITLFSKAYELSGAVGNVGLALFLGNEIDLLLYFFKQIMSKIEHGLEELREKHSEFIEASIVSAQHREWRKHYFAFTAGLAKANEHKTIFLDAISAIRTLASKVNSEAYLTELQQQIGEFRRSVAQIVTRCQIAATPRYSLIASSSRSSSAGFFSLESSRISGGGVAADDVITLADVDETLARLQSLD